MKSCLVLLLLLSSYHEVQARTGLQLQGYLQRFEQQAKGEIGDDRGQRLVNIRQSTFAMSWFYEVFKRFDLGVYGRLDRGIREMAIYQGQDENSKTVVTGKVGGAYEEYWLGPSLRFRYKYLQLRLAHGSIVRRRDDGREDLPDVNGNSGDPFKVDGSSAWVFSFGLRGTVARGSRIIADFEYRIRYYDKRAEENLIANVVHGTQDFTPLMGIEFVY